MSQVLLVGLPGQAAVPGQEGSCGRFLDGKSPGITRAAGRDLMVTVGKHD